MPDLTAAQALSPALPLAAAAGVADDDCALGCECAHPALQLDGWDEEAAAAEAA